MSRYYLHWSNGDDNIVLLHYVQMMMGYKEQGKTASTISIDIIWPIDNNILTNKLCSCLSTATLHHMCMHLYYNDKINAIT